MPRRAALALDFGGTLALPSARVSDPVVEHSLQRTSNVSGDLLRRLTAGVMSCQRRTEQLDRDRHTETSFASIVQLACADCGVELSTGQADAASQLIYQLTADGEVVAGIREALIAAKRHEMALVLASNTKRPLALRLQTLAAAGIDWLFDSIVLSSVLGVRKPDRSFYSEVERVARVERKRIWFIGNSWEKDVAAPMAYGMNAVHVRFAEETPSIITRLIDEICGGP